jgi:sulfoxide reductase heme-binding subunit YedZ
VAAGLTGARLARATLFALLALPGASLAADLAAGALATPYRAILQETGFWSMRLLTAGLLLPPLATLTGRAWVLAPRRMVGLFAAAYAFAHAWAWCRQHGYDWRFLLGELPRPYLLLGLFALALLAPLVATSNDRARRALGAAWARLHRLAWAIAVLAVLHFMLSRAFPTVESGIEAALIALALAWRLARPPAPAPR